MPPKTRPSLDRRAGAAALATLTLGALAGCGSSSSHTTSNVAASAPASTAPAVATTAAARRATLTVLSPRAGEHTGSTVTVRVRLDGAPSGTAHAFRYVLDGRVTRHAGDTVTFSEVAPGRHRVEVLLSADGTVKAERSFAVRAPVPAPTQAAPEQPMTTEQHQPEPAPEAKKEPAPKAAEPKEPAPSSGGIPQNGGGDGDGDNSGGPSDGDGNV